jgi:hypothetical protein
MNRPMAFYAEIFLFVLIAVAKEDVRFLPNDDTT